MDMMKNTNTTQYAAFCQAWISIGSAVVVDANRRIQIDGHAATMANLAAIEACCCALCAYSKKHPQLDAPRCSDLRVSAVRS